jgi:cell division protein FtsQ
MKGYWFALKMIFIGGLLLFLMGFAHKRNTQRTCRDLAVQFVGNPQPFIALDSVNKLLIQNKEPLSSIPKETLVLKEMEARLVQHPMVYQAQVFISIDGEIGAKIQTKKPIGRVLGTPGFYIDEQGQPMPLSNLYTARVPIVTGEVLLHLEALKELLLTLRQDDFLDPMVTEVAVDAQGNCQLRLRQETYKLLVGPVINVSEKLRNFKAFYQNMQKQQEQKQFKKIDLRFNNQVVATE